MENKTGKYLKYAIGEILLVIIGILIAVSLNSWKENRKLKAEEQILLKDLRQEVIENLKSLEHIIDEHEKSLKAATEIRELFSNRESFKTMKDRTFRQLVLKMFINYTYDPRNGILNSIISSGKIYQLTDKELKYLLASVKEQTTDAFESSIKIERQRDALWDSSMENSFVIEKGRLIKERNWKSLYDYPRFRSLNNRLFYHTRTEGLDEEKKLKSTLQKIIVLIDKNIEKDN